MHAQIRRLLRASPRWDGTAWGDPINQVDMAGTVLLFSLVLVDGLRMLGFRIGRQECEDVLHLWRVAGWVLGVEPELLCATEPEARCSGSCSRPRRSRPTRIRRSRRGAARVPLHEARSARSARGERFLPLGYGIGRHHRRPVRGRARLPEDAVAPRRPGAANPHLRDRPVMGRLPGIDRVALEAGLRYWRRTVKLGLAGEEARFEIPARVGRA
jgi:hypothetical protein